MISQKKPNTPLLILVILATNVLTICALLLLFEGFLGWYHFFKQLWKFDQLAEEIHTEYDPLVGWINKPNFFVKDMYGPGNDLTLLADRTRLTSHQPIKKSAMSIICSGDSFTLGYGVSDTEGWCARLSEHGWNMINMGQGGYGIDNSFVLYERDAETIPHNIHITAFNTLDFDRTYSDEFVGYGKPYFQADGDTIVNVNSPVPKPSPLKRFLAKNRIALDGLNSFRFLTKYQKKPGEGEDRHLVTARMIGQMSQLTKERGALHVFVLLPTIADHPTTEWYQQHREFVQKLSEKYDFKFIDVGTEMEKLPADTFESLFIEKGVMKYNGSEWHYTEEGNQVVADIIATELERFIQNSEVPRLSQTQSPSSSRPK